MSPRAYSEPSWHPSGMRPLLQFRSGGFVALPLNHRLMALNPSGSGAGRRGEVHDILLDRPLLWGGMVGAGVSFFQVKRRKILLLPNC